MIKRIRELQQARPFRPYEIELSSGRTLVIANPDLLSSSESGPGWIAVWQDDPRHPGEPDLVTVSTLHITQVRAKPAESELP